MESVPTYVLTATLMLLLSVLASHGELLKPPPEAWICPCEPGGLKDGIPSCPETTEVMPACEGPVGWGSLPAPPAGFPSWEPGPTLAHLGSIPMAGSAHRMPRPPCSRLEPRWQGVQVPEGLQWAGPEGVVEHSR